MRDLVAETQLEPRHFIMPFFVIAGEKHSEPIGSLAGVNRYSVDTLLQQIETCLELGIKAVMFFGVVDAEYKNATGSYSHAEQGPVQQALQQARAHFGNDIVLMTDVCMCGYTDHGHCGVVQAQERAGQHSNIVANDPTLDILAEMALSHARAGADTVAPSDMMDGRVAAIRQRLDENNFSNVSILSYSVKYASAFYGPFRDAAQSSPKDVGIKDRKSYQMDMRNAREALLEARLDESEGADMLMVKPALAYLDIIRDLRQYSTLPLVAYNVSGEYAMIKAAASAGVLDEASAVRESLFAMRRAGADMIISYHAMEALQQGWLYDL